MIVLQNIFENFEQYKSFIDIEPELGELTEDDILELKDRPLPKRATQYSAAYDLESPIKVVVNPGERKTIYFGYIVTKEESDPYNCYISPRSSLAKKKGLKFTTDKIFISSNDFPYPLYAEVFNFTNKPVVIDKNERIAQATFTDESLELDDLRFDIKKFENVKDSTSEYTFRNEGDWKFYFQSPVDVDIEPYTVSSPIMTGIKCNLAKDEVLFLNFNAVGKKLCLANGIGVIDSDYYENENNDGNIGVLLFNTGYLPVHVNRGDVISVGYIEKYVTIDGDAFSEAVRKGGFGSTGK